MAVVRSVALEVCSVVKPTPSTGPLAGLKVVDFTRVLSGPFATMILADLGADVVKIEDPKQGDDTRHWGPPFVQDESAYFMSVNRNKRSLALDLKSEGGRAVAHRLAAGADIVVENFRPGVAAKLGIGYAELSAANPTLIYASISGYGQTSSEAAKPGYDPIMQARSGLMSITGDREGGPSRVGVASADISAGMWTAIGVLSALVRRAESGRGQWIDLSLLDAQVSLLTNVAGAWFASGNVPARYGTGHPSIVPSEAFEAADGMLMVAAGNDKMWVRMAYALGIDDLATDARFATNAQRVIHRAELRERLENLFRTAGTAVWLEKLEAGGVPASRVNTVGEALTDPLLLERDMIVELEHSTVGTVRSVGNPIKLSETPATMRLAPPVLGEHTHDVLSEAGLTEEEIEILIDRGHAGAPTRQTALYQTKDTASA
jgi:crotonobetainyl-CoA:carnitine CoA-transferase CaiB-like acyl-CoA transferase